MYSDKRLNEKAINETGIDYDWYFYDKEGKIAIVASGGGLIPEKVAMNMDNLDLMIKNYRSFPIISDEINLEPYVLEKITEYDQKQKENYLKDINFMVSRGFFYYDKMILNDYFDFKYILKAKPNVPLTMNELIKHKIDLMPMLGINQLIEETKIFSVVDMFY